MYVANSTLVEKNSLILNFLEVNAVNREILCINQNKFKGLIKLGSGIKEGNSLHNITAFICTIMLLILH